MLQNVSNLSPYCWAYLSTKTTAWSKTKAKQIMIIVRLNRLVYLVLALMSGQHAWYWSKSKGNDVKLRYRKKLAKDSFPPRLQLKQTKTFFFIFIWAVIRCQDVCNWAISNRHLTLRGNRSTDGKQNLLVSFKHTVFSFSISFNTATQHLLRVVMEVFEKPFSSFQVRKFNPYNSSCLAKL